MRFKKTITVAVIGAVGSHAVELAKGGAGSTVLLEAIDYSIAALSTGDTGAIAHDGSRHVANHSGGKAFTVWPDVRKPGMMQNDTGGDTG